MSCEIAGEDLSRYAAGDCDAETGERLARHVSGCDVCARRLEGIRKVDAALRALPPLRPSADTLLRVRRALGPEVRGSAAPEVMSLEQAADYLQVSVENMEEALWDLPVFEVAGQVRMRRSKLIEWMERRERQYARERASSEVTQMLAGEESEHATFTR